VFDRVRATINRTTLLAPVTSRYTAALQPNVPTRVLDVADGTSNTLGFAEMAGNPDLYALGRPAGRTDEAGIWADHRNPQTFDGCDPATGSADNNSPPGPRTVAVNCSNDGEMYSFHAGGANVMLCDGSVRFLRDTVSIGVAVALITRANGEAVPGDF
jgi:prepilin-type processing-associated H-X9-DG protein